MNRKLKAFTLMELLVAMVLSAIVIASAGLGYQFMMERYGNYKKANDEVLELATFYAVLNNDMQVADEVVVAGEEVECRKDSSVVVYGFGADWVVRVQGSAFSVQGELASGIVDTFKVGINEVKTMAIENTGLVEQLSLETEGSTLVVNKEYGADRLLDALSEPPNNAHSSEPMTNDQ